MSFHKDLGPRRIPEPLPPAADAPVQIKDGYLQIGTQRYEVSLMREGKAQDLDETSKKSLLLFAAAVLNSLEGEDLAVNRPTAILTGAEPKVELEDSEHPGRRVVRQLDTDSPAFALAQKLDDFVQDYFSGLTKPVAKVDEEDEAAPVVDAGKVTLRPVDDAKPHIATEAERRAEEPARYEFSTHLDGLPDTYSRSALQTRVQNTTRPAEMYLDALGNLAMGLHEDSELDASAQRRLENWETAEDGLPALLSRYQAKIDEAHRSLVERLPDDAGFERLTDEQVKELIKGGEKAKNDQLPISSNFKSHLKNHHKKLVDISHQARRQLIREVANEIDPYLDPIELNQAIRGQRRASARAKKRVKLAEQIISRRAAQLRAQIPKEDSLPASAADRMSSPYIRHGIYLAQDYVNIDPGRMVGSDKKQKKLVDGQLNALANGWLGLQKRTTVTNTVTLGDDEIYESRMTPLNGEFDRHTLGGTADEGPFKKVFGVDGGVGSGEISNPHLKNAYETRLGRDGELKFRALRHGIVARLSPEQQAKELLQAAVMQELSDLELSPQDAAAGHPLELNIGSVSLVSPSLLEALRPHRTPFSEDGSLRNEFKLWRQQVEALRGLAGDGSQPVVVNIQGHEVKVNLNILSFNFGVNSGAVSKLRYGVDEQWKTNGQTRKQLQAVKDEYFQRMDVIAAAHEEVKDRVNEARRDANMLMADIGDLLETRNSYLSGPKGGNQYEVGAKILCLLNVLDSCRRDVRAELGAIEGLPGGYKAAFNCMSGKDRTGVMDAMAKALTVLRERKGHWVQHWEFEKDRALQLDFANLVIQMLIQGGGLEITKQNTGVHGYKVSKECLPWHKDKELWKQAFSQLSPKGADVPYFAGLLGLSSTVGS